MLKSPLFLIFCKLFWCRCSPQKTSGQAADTHLESKENHLMRRLSVDKLDLWIFWVKSGPIFHQDPLMVHRSHSGDSWIWVIQGPMVPMVQDVQSQAPIIGILGGIWVLGTWQTTWSGDKWGETVRSVVFQTIPRKKCWFLKSTFLLIEEQRWGCKCRTTREHPLAPIWSRHPLLYLSSQAELHESLFKKKKSVVTEGFQCCPDFRTGSNVVVQSFWIWGARDPKKQLLVVALAASLRKPCVCHLGSTG